MHEAAHAGTDMPLTWANAVGPAGLEPATLGLKVGRTVCQVVPGRTVTVVFVQVTATFAVRDVSAGVIAAGVCRVVREKFGQKCDGSGRLGA